MSKFKPVAFFILLLSFILSGAALADTQSQSDTQMVPPKPIDNKVYDAMVGTWHGDANMMGKKMREKLDIRWGLDHQFLFVRLEATSIENPAIKYKGLGIFGIDSTGKAKTWWFDNWGASAVSTGEGSFDNNKLTLNDSNPMFQETRNFEINGNTMTMHAKGSMRWQGKDMPFDETTVFKKGG